MANQVYSGFIDAILGAYLGLSPPAAVPQFKVHLIGPAYSFDDDHVDTSSIVGELATPRNLENVVIAGGVISADNVLNAFDGSGLTTLAALIVSVDDRLVCYIDQGDLVSLPSISDGTALDIIWSPDGIVSV